MTFVGPSKILNLVRSQEDENSSAAVGNQNLKKGTYIHDAVVSKEIFEILILVTWVTLFRMNQRNATELNLTRILKI